MKSFYLLMLCILFISPGFNNLLFAQSDRKIVDNYNTGYNTIEQSIKDAKTLTELNAVAIKINSLEQNFKQHKNLLDKSLYPHNFNESIEKLNKLLLLRRDDIARIDVLEAELAELKQQAEFLNTRNNELLVQIQYLEGQTTKDVKTITDLENLVAELRTSIRKRDSIVLSMIDSLMPSIMKDKEVLSREDRNIVTTGEQKLNVINNVKATISDNIRFMQLTSLTPDDLKSMNEQQKDFANKWNKVGAKLISVYVEDKNKTAEINEINDLLNSWSAVIVNGVWDFINVEFSLNGIELRSFKNGDEFTTAVIYFIDNELRNIGIKSEPESKDAYTRFADSVWSGTIEKVWLSFLIKNKMLSAENLNKIERKHAEWKNALYPLSWWIYLVIPLVVIASLIFFFIKRKKVIGVKISEQSEQ
jgi:hypothetical protein